MEQLYAWRDKRIIKVITGVRRSGKSTLLMQFREELQNEGIAQEQIQFVNFEDLSNEPLLDYRKLHDHILSRLTPDKQNYIFLDEIQMVKDFQRTIDSLSLRPNVDIYITGSNAYMLSSEIATLLSGRYIEIRMLPFSFSEFASAFNDNTERAYRRYISETSFPYILNLPSQDAVREYLNGLYSTVVLKDILSRRNLADMDLLDKIVRFLCDSLGSLFSIKNIVNNLASGGRKVSDHTVSIYLDALVESYLFYKVPRYDIRGKQNLKVGQKYDITDLGFRHLLLGISNNDLGHLLENVIYLELIRRGFQVMVGKQDSTEIDFVAFKSGQVSYYQVSLSVRSEETLQRELAPLMKVNDFYPKYLLTLDNDPLVSHNGIQQIYALDWLLENR